MRALSLLLAIAGCQDIAAQSEPAPRDEPETRVVEEIVVRGQAQRGMAIGAQEPELVLTESDIAAYGVSTIGELLQAIAAETNSNASRRDVPPVVLLNGRRISGFREIGRYPVEAVSRVEVLSEEVSLSYGFAPTQRVINFILKDNVKILAVETSARSPEAGGSTEVGVAAQNLHVSGNTRMSFDVSASDRPAIVESERDIAGGPVGDVTDRAILGDLNTWSVGSSYAMSVLTDAVATSSASLDRSELSTPLGGAGFRQQQTTDELNLGLSLNGPLAPTIWGVTAGHQSIDQKIESIVGADNGAIQSVEQQQSTTRIDGIINTQFRGTFAAPLAVAMNFGVARERQDSVRRADNSAFAVGRDALELGMSVDATDLQPLGLRGALSVNGNVALRRLSDIGTLTSVGANLNWRVNDHWQWSVGYNKEAGAPELTALSAPLVVLPNARVFDFTTNTLTVGNIVTGGNPQLSADERQIATVGLRLYPQGTSDLTFAMDYATVHVDDETRQFDVLTRAFERAFPERVVRNSNGELLQFDARPVRTRSSRQRNLQSSLSWSRRIKVKRKRATGPRPKKRLRSGRPGNFRLGLVHNWTLQDDVILTEAGGVLDLLNGGATSVLGGTPGHTVDLTAYRWNEGFGSFVAISYQSSTRVGTSNNTLRFDDRVLLNARLSYEFNYANTLVARWPMLEEARVLLDVTNLFNDPIAVRDTAGQTPTTLQPDLLDPIGRRWGLEIRKRF